MYLKCACSTCSGHIEFDVSGLGRTVTCPHCGWNTLLFDPHGVNPNAGTEVRYRDSLVPIGESGSQLPEFSDESFRNLHVRSSEGAGYYTVNLIDYTCTCPSFVNDHSKASRCEFGRMCKHICKSLNNQQILPLLNPICRAMVKEGYGIYPGRFELDENGNTVYVTGVNSEGWLNVFALKRKDGKNYYRFGYNINERRWAYDEHPKVNEKILYLERGFSTHPSAVYYFSTDGQPQGPVPAADLRSMRKDGFVTDDTPVIREGHSEWKTYKDFLALSR
jgi:hypothetical protein